MRRITSIALGAAMLVAITIVCLGATLLHNSMESNQAEHVSPFPQYGEQGLYYGQSLSTQIVKKTNDFLYLEDRALKKYQSNAASEAYTAETINTILASLPKTTTPYVMLTPLRIATEPEFSQYSDDQGQAIQSIYEKLPAATTKLDVYATLLAHRNEYIYFRTDDSWTALGAYYGSRLFLDAAGITGIDISQYEDYKFESYLGALAMSEDGAYLEDYPDYVAYYTLKDKTNWQTVCVRLGKDDYQTHESPAVALSRRGTDIFIAGRYSHSILQGDGNNGKTLLILGDSAASFLAPWLTPYYENIYLINLARYQGEAEGYQQIWKDYNVTDCLILETSEHFGESVENQRAWSICGGGA